MKTTIDIADSLLSQAKSLAAREQTTLRSLVEEGLRRIVEDRRHEAQYRIPDRSFKGRGLQAGIEDGDWEAMRDLAYKGRGS